MTVTILKAGRKLRRSFKVRSRKQPVEDAVFGYRAAGAALLSNLSIERGSIVKWDPNAMKVL